MSPGGNGFFLKSPNLRFRGSTHERGLTRRNPPRKIIFPKEFFWLKNPGTFSTASLQRFRIGKTPGEAGRRRPDFIIITNKE
jgi:hypothetical protein